MQADNVSVSKDVLVPLNLPRTASFISSTVVKYLTAAERFHNILCLKDSVDILVFLHFFLHLRSGETVSPRNVSCT